MDLAPTIPENILFRAPSPQNPGAFVLGKSLLIVEGENVTRSNRCDNLTYSWELPCHRTDYHNDGIYLGETSIYTGRKFTTEDVKGFVRIIEVPGKFCISYYICHSRINNNIIDDGDYILFDNYPASLWYGKSLIELFKNMREWTMLLGDPFNLNHPMSEISELAFSTFDPPDWFFQELDSLPDMHLVRFLKGDSDHRNFIENFPQMSDRMINWFKEKINLYPPKTTLQRISELQI